MSVGRKGEKLVWLGGWNEEFGRMIGRNRVGFETLSGGTVSYLFEEPPKKLQRDRCV